MVKISQAEINTVIKILKKIEPGFLPFDLFRQFARLYVTPIIEIVPLKKDRNEKITTILLPREKDDPDWPGMMHTPGTVLRASDKKGNLTNAFTRIIKDELHNLKIVHGPELVDYEFHQTKRGREFALIFFVEYSGSPKTGQEIIVDQLPRNTVKTQIKFIKKATEVFKTYLKQ